MIYLWVQSYRDQTLDYLLMLFLGLAGPAGALFAAALVVFPRWLGRELRAWRVRRAAARIRRSMERRIARVYPAPSPDSIPYEQYVLIYPPKQTADETEVRS